MEDITAGGAVGIIVGFIVGIALVGIFNMLMMSFSPWEECSTKELIQPKQIIVDINTNDTTYIYKLREEYTKKFKK